MQQQCTPQFSVAQQCVRAVEDPAMKECDPSAPASSAQYEACTDIYECVRSAYGAQMEQCCDCIAFLASSFDKNLGINCVA